MAAQGDQLVVGAALGDAAVLHDHDAVRLADGGEAVRDDEGGAALEQRLQRLLDQDLGMGVDGGGRFI